MSEDNNKLTSLSSSLLSGLHKYAGDSDHLKLRLVFTEHALLATRPRFRSNKLAHQIGHKPPSTDNKQIRPYTKQRNDNDDDGGSGFYSSYLIKRKRNGVWTIRPEVRNCPLMRSGWKLRVTSRGRVGCGSCANIRSDNSHGGGRGFVRKNKPNGSDGGTNTHEDDKLEKEDQLTKSERAFNWKDTVAVTSDKNDEWQRRMARKLPSEMRNHHRQYHHHHLQTTTRGATHSSGLSAAPSACGRFDMCAHCCNSLDDGSKIAEPGDVEGCQLLTDWYESKLLNKTPVGMLKGWAGLEGTVAKWAPPDITSKEGSKTADSGSLRPPATSVPMANSVSKDGRNGARLARGREYDHSNDGNRKSDHSGPMCSEQVAGLAPLTLTTDAKLDSQSKEGPRLKPPDGVVSDANTNLDFPTTMDNDGDEIVKQRELPSSIADISPTSIGSRCSHVEILYITMEKHELNDSVAGGESFALLSTTTTTTTMTSTTVGAAGISTADATVSTAPTELDGKTGDSNIQHHERSSTDNVRDVNSQSSDDERNRYHHQGGGGGGGDTKNNDGGNNQEHIEAYINIDADKSQDNKASGSRNTTAYGYDEHYESSDKDENEENDKRMINLTTDRQQDRRMLQKEAQSNKTLDNGSRLVLAVIVIDKLNRFVQLKPDLNKQISVDISAAAEICASGGGLNDATATRISTTEQTNATATSGFGAKVSMTPMQYSLLYQLELISATSRSETPHRGASGSVIAGPPPPAADSEVNLLYRHLFWKPQEHSDRSHQVGGFFGPVNGSVLIKLQFDIHFASDFPKDCRNLYVKYKLLARLKGGSQWKLRRCRPQLATGEGIRRMKEEQEEMLAPGLERPRLATLMAPREQKLAQMMSHHPNTSNSAPSNRIKIPSAALDEGGDEPKKPSAKSTLASQSAKSSAVNDGHQPAASTAGGLDTCLLDGSTITSEPDSSGRFHFACVEELLLELVVCDNKDRHNKSPMLNATQSLPPLSSRSLSLSERRRHQPLQESLESPLIGTPNNSDQRITMESSDLRSNKVTTCNMDQPLVNNHRGALAEGPKAANGNYQQSSGVKSPSGDDGDIPSSSSSSSVLPRNDDSNHATIINNETGYNRASLDNHNDETTPGNKSINTAGEVPNDASCPRDLDNNNAADDNYSDTTKARAEIVRDGELEIVLLFEFYSSDFYRDKLQGWSHLSIPVDLDPKKPTRKNTETMEPHLSANPRTTPYVLPVIRPELCSLLDKLRYYLIGQLPASLPSIESFARSNHRYMLLTRQSGKLALNFEIVSQLSDPNFDTALRDLLEIGKGHSKKVSQYNGADLDHIRHQRLADNKAADLADSDCSDNEEDGGLDTRGVVAAYKRAKNRIDRLNLESLLVTN